MSDSADGVVIPPRLVDDVLATPWRWLQHESMAPQDVRGHSLAILEDLARAEQRVRSEYIGRYPVELLQNAHDACDDANMSGRVWIEVTPGALLVANEGEPFDGQRVHAPTRLGSGTKNVFGKWVGVSA